MGAATAKVPLPKKPTSMIHIDGDALRPLALMLSCSISPLEMRPSLPPLKRDWRVEFDKRYPQSPQVDRRAKRGGALLSSPSDRPRSGSTLVKDSIRLAKERGLSRASLRSQQLVVEQTGAVIPVPPLPPSIAQQIASLTQRASHEA